ncbi:MAG: ABC transporter permease, partial [Pyrinomonadaceae bacterium]
MRLSLWPWRRRHREEELDEELRSHMEMAVKDRIERGETLEEAEAAVRHEFGNVGLIKEVTREMWGGVRLDQLLQDIRYGLRFLRRGPGFTAVAVLTLALGIGASTAIFSAVNPILFEPLPYPHADRVMMIWDFAGDGSRLYPTFGTYRELVERNHSFDAIAVMRPWQPTMTGRGEAERLDGQRVSASYFQVLGVPPSLGRDFDPSDDQINGPKVAIISDGLWRQRFGGDRAVVGRQITLDANAYVVIGVMPGAFENLLAPSAQLWTPLQYDKSLPPEGREWGHHLRMTGRLRSGVGTDQAHRELNVIAHNPVMEFSRPAHASLDNGLMLNSLQDDMTSGVKPALLAILGAVLLVLLIACVNVTNLLLARGAQ